jgi:protein involved in polysaccharide export with SLBB domain
MLNYSHLTQNQPADYKLGQDDTIGVLLPGFDQKATIQTIRAQVVSDGTVQLPLVGTVNVGGLTLRAAQEKINAAYADGFIKDPVGVTLEEKATVGVLVLGQVKEPGVHYLPKFQNDVGHAIAAAGGLTDEAASEIELHRKSKVLAKSGKLQGTDAHQVRQANVEFEAAESRKALLQREQLAYRGRDRFESAKPLKQAQTSQESAKSPSREVHVAVCESASQLRKDEPVAQVAHVSKPAQSRAQDWQTMEDADGSIVKISLHGPGANSPVDGSVILNAGDVVVVPSREYEAFYVVGKLSQNNLVRFSTGDRQRELGVGFVLPREREIDVVTAVAMAGYIDPIDSPTTVTVQRTMSNGEPLLIRVDLIKARYSRQETVLVEAGDIIYLNPDSQWWFRRTFDRIIPAMFTESLRKALR